MANPYTPGTVRYKLFAYASVTKSNSDKASALFTETNFGKGLYDLSGGTAVPLTNLPKSGAAGAAHSSR